MILDNANGHLRGFGTILQLILWHLQQLAWKLTEFTVWQSIFSVLQDQAFPYICAQSNRNAIFFFQKTKWQQLKIYKKNVFLKPKARQVLWMSTSQWQENISSGH